MTIRAEQVVNSSPYYDSSVYKSLGIDPDDSFSISRCKTCNFVFTSELPSAEFLETLYRPHSDLAESIRVFARPQRAAYAFNVISTLLTAISRRIELNSQGVPIKPVRILDVGCAFGTGSLGLACQFYPYEIVGIEWSKETRDYLECQGMQAYQSIEDLPADSFFDGVLLNDVLEHLPEPLGFMESLRSVSHSNTVVWINVPDFSDRRLAHISNLVAANSMEVPKDLNPWEHLSYFSPQTLEVLMKRAGFVRMSSGPVSYPVQCDSLYSLAKSLVRAVRDFWRIYTKRYPSAFLTSGLFLPAD